MKNKYNAVARRHNDRYNPSVPREIFRMINIFRCTFEREIFLLREGKYHENKHKEEVAMLALDF